jgi:hypothetical protein
MNKLTLVKSLVLASAAVLPTPSMFAQTADAPAQTLPDRFSYAAKFVCGTSTIPTTQPPMEPAVKRGNYATAVNIRNPWATPVTITKHIVVALAERYPDTPFIPPSTRVRETLPPGRALYVDCQEVIRLLHAALPGPFIEGFVVIDSFSQPSPTAPAVPAEVDVVAVTTAAGIAAAGVADTGVTTHDITPVQGRKLPAGVWPF